MSLIKNLFKFNKQAKIVIEAESFYHILESIPVSVVITDPSLPDNPIIYCNAIFLKLTGYSKEEVIGKNCRFLQGEETTKKSVETIREAIENQEPVKQVIINYTKSGERFLNELIIVPVMVNGKNTQFIAIQNDLNRMTYR